MYSIADCVFIKRVYQLVLVWCSSQGVKQLENNEKLNGPGEYELFVECCASHILCCTIFIYSDVTLLSLKNNVYTGLKQCITYGVIIECFNLSRRVEK